MTLVVIDTYLPSYSSLHVKQFNFCITALPKLRNNTQLRRQLVSLHIPCFHLFVAMGNSRKYPYTTMDSFHILNPPCCYIPNPSNS